MPSKKRRPEKHFYEPVRTFLRTKMGCVVESHSKDGTLRKFVGRGLGGLIVDVFGLRGVKDKDSRAIEGIAVEVKRTAKRTSLRSIAQASQYGRLAHRCYLAQPREYDHKNLLEASRFGVGLLQITSKGIKIITESKRFKPEPDTFDMFLNKSLRIVRCAICSCYLFRYKPLLRGVAICGHWVLDQIAPINRSDDFNKKVYMCGKCEEVLSSVAGFVKLRQAIHRLEKRTHALEKKLKRQAR